jgi:transcriptional regulator of acetoin/glycerol metabolism
LSITGGNISDAARRLGVHRSTLHRKMTRYGLATEEELAADAVQNEGA